MFGYGTISQLNTYQLEYEILKTVANHDEAAYYNELYESFCRNFDNTVTVL